jgi:hypothetical protein
MRISFWYAIPSAFNAFEMACRRSILPRRLSLLSMFDGSDVSLQVIYLLKVPFDGVVISLPSRCTLSSASFDGAPVHQPELFVYASFSKSRAFSGPSRENPIQHFGH